MGNTNHGHQVALSQQKDLVVQELPDELMLYDLKRHKAHCLNTTAAMVWNHCNGRTTVAEMAALLEKEVGSPVDEEVVLYALDKLEQGRPARRAVRPVSREWIIEAANDEKAGRRSNGGPPCGHITGFSDSGAVSDRRGYLEKSCRRHVRIASRPAP